VEVLAVAVAAIKRREERVERREEREERREERGEENILATTKQQGNKGVFICVFFKLFVCYESFIMKNDEGRVKDGRGEARGEIRECGWMD
jgi:hypothetical protein